ncbi:hypothetical protein BN946_scf184816.g8 [Trametes cinnabarina]|uniref:Uncharacterized protein n=1 Tax=Pycnoporus cinnabarinus TaxID=5643 RepID=A0A060SJ23_PYCCI|nr:hypothetical protein BN946_scf184816.g8 [Trametes cinnabarina]
MRHSGERAKYPLATVDRIITVLGHSQAIRHDIACSFTKTLGNSSIGIKAQGLNVMLCVNAFHDHAHNRLCQLRYHPLYLQTLGLEDLETCRFLYNNYKQALAIIQEYTPIVEEFKKSNNVTEADFEGWHSEELAYLTNLVQEPPEDLVKVTYIKSLEVLKAAQASWNALSIVNTFVTTFGVEDVNDAAHKKRKQGVFRAKIAERNAALHKYECAEEAILDMERRMGITERWMEELERLVIQRLFKLSKANLAGTGYKMRRQISKHLVCRSNTIRSAIKKYNELASLQDPPHQQLEYTDIMAYGWLGKFELLKHSWYAILEKPWASPVCRDVMNKYFKLQCAQAKVFRLNVEIPRLQKWVDDDNAHSRATAAAHQQSQPLLAAEILAVYKKRHRVNDVHRLQLEAVYSLNGYSGPCPAGTKAISSPSTVTEDTDILPDEDDHLNDEAVCLEEVVTRMVHVILM